MLHMRPYQPEDAQTIITWCRDEHAFRQWSADRYDHYPIAPEDMNAMYADAPNLIPLTAFDQEGVVGHLILRYPDAKKDTLRIGFVIVDSARRGCGYGKDMLNMALFYAFCVARVRRVTLGVFENNPAACACYRSVGFREVALEQQESYHVLGEVWPCREMQIDQDEWRKHGTEAGHRQAAQHSPLLYD